LQSVYKEVLVVCAPGSFCSLCTRKFLQSVYQEVPVVCVPGSRVQTEK
jgi:hypothetical protein